jgi:ABC-type transport system substrate-binding protein
MGSTRGAESTLVLLATSLLALGMGGGCMGSLEPPLPAVHPDEETPRRGGVLHLATFTADIETLDPPLIRDMLSSNVARLLYAGLVDFDANGAVVPDVASRFESLEGDLGYRFVLREGVRFHDGTELTADDVKRSIERALSPDTPAPNAELYEAIEGYAAFASRKAPHLEGVVVEGRYVVSIHLHERDGAFLSALAMAPLRVTCPSAGDRYSPSFVPCGAGPFRLPPGGWQHGRSLTLVRHDGYFRPSLPYLDGVTWQLGATQISQSFKFTRGEIDWVRDLTQPDTIRYQADERWRSLGRFESSLNMQGEAMNNAIPPFDNVEIRRAVAAAIDRDHVVMLRASNLSTLTKPLPLSFPGYDPPPLGQKYDPAAALEHMQKAGYPFDPASGKGGWPARIVYDVATKTIQEFVSQSVQQDLAKIGLRIELHLSSQTTFYALTSRRGKSAMSPQGWQADFPDPSDFLDSLFATGSIRDESATNYAFYSNPTVDADIARARGERDRATRTRLYADAERIICVEAPWAFEYTYRFYAVHQAYVRNTHAHAVWAPDVVDVWLDRERDAIAARGGPLSRGLFGGSP